MQSSKNNSRLQYLDWVRGLAAVIMLQGHAFHALVKPELRTNETYIFSQFIGGMPPAVFLFLTGVTLAFLMHSNERKGLSAHHRFFGALRRAGYLLLLAFAFRLQLWAFSWPDSPWTDLFRVDILNCMGLAMAVMSSMSIFRTRDRVRFCAVLGLAIAAASPLVSQIDWSHVHPGIKSYLAPDYSAFGFFPWAAFVAFGMSAGSFIRLIEGSIERPMQWAASLGLALIVGGHFFSTLPYSMYSNSEFWLNSPALILIKTGVILLMLVFGFLWTTYGAGQSWSWIRQFGVTSLLVYWIHIELVYGRWLWPWKENLTIPQTVVASVALTVLMLAISTIKTNWNVFAALLWSPVAGRSEPRTAVRG